MNTNDLIIEIGTEELPPKSLRRLANAFQENILVGLENATLTHGEAKWFATPKRLAAYIPVLQGKQEDQIVEKRGPAVSAAFDDAGNPTKAALGWARGNGISIEEAERLKTDKGEWLLLRKAEQGKTINALIEAIILQALKQLPIPKNMRWGNNSEEFVRPIHSVLVMFGTEVIPVVIKGKTASNKLQGHRFHSPEFVSLSNASDYEATLNKHYVIADHNARKSFILKELEEAAKKLNASVDLDKDLLEEVTSLVEWPVIMTANFEEHFLDVPKEALIYTMKGDQKYFPLLDASGNLLPKFLFVSNIKSIAPEKVIAGNERVIRPRLADAEFFYVTDLKTNFAKRIENLESIVFQKQLGTVKERVERIATVAKSIASTIGANEDDAYRAGLLCKNDLVSNMVLEFPAMQGTMGRYYAKASGENSNVSNAIGEQYLPAFSGDSLPSNKESASVALAEKLDTLVGIFSTGQIPKGDKDPFALRRAAIGILRICLEKELPLDLANLINVAAKVVQPKFEQAIDEAQILDFLFARLKSMYIDQDIDSKVVQSVLMNKPSIVLDFNARIRAVNQFVGHPSADSLIAANRRVANILKKSQDETGEAINGVIDESLFELEQESNLNNSLKSIQQEIVELAGNYQYTEALTKLATLKGDIDNFFDNVMVNTDNELVKNNRLNLLFNLRTTFLNIADVSVLN